MTDIIDDIRTALLLANPKELEMFRRYLQWLLVRRKINKRFYFQAHWIRKPGQQYHWLGKL
jgi:hypothetical protein